MYFVMIRTIYDNLKTGVRSEDDKQMIDQRIDEITTNARFCQYKSGDKSAAKELRSLRTKAAQSLLANSAANTHAATALGALAYQSKAGGQQPRQQSLYD